MVFCFVRRCLTSSAGGACCFGDGCDGGCCPLLGGGEAQDAPSEEGGCIELLHVGDVACGAVVAAVGPQAAVYLDGYLGLWQGVVEAPAADGVEAVFGHARCAGGGGDGAGVGVEGFGCLVFLHRTSGVDVGFSGFSPCFSRGAKARSVQRGMGMSPVDGNALR